MRTPVKGSIDDWSMPVTAAPTSRMQMRHHYVCEREIQRDRDASFIYSFL